MVKKAMLSPKHGIHGKRKSTLIKEQVIREHAERMLASLGDMAAIQIEIAKLGYDKKKPNSRLLDVKLRATEVITERVLGKAKANVDVSITMPRPIYSGQSRIKDDGGKPE